jgi:hypothetical protein
MKLLVLVLVARMARLVRGEQLPRLLRVFRLVVPVFVRVVQE